MKRFVSFVLQFNSLPDSSCSPGSDTNTIWTARYDCPFETEKPSGTQRTESNTTEIHEASTLRADKTTEFTINIPDITTTRDLSRRQEAQGSTKRLKESLQQRQIPSRV
jgi:hypothetical protein